jgi:hypothetical protein
MVAVDAAHVICIDTGGPLPLLRILNKKRL